MNTCATAIMGTWVERPNVCRTESASICQSLCGTKPVKNKNNQNAKVHANQLILYCPVTGRLEIICYTTKNVHLTTKTISLLFFLKHNPIFDLSVLKSIFITLCKPNLRRKKDFVYKHKLLVQVKKNFFWFQILT